MPESGDDFLELGWNDTDSELLWNLRNEVCQIAAPIGEEETAAMQLERQQKRRGMARAAADRELTLQFSSPFCLGSGFKRCATGCASA